MDESPKNTDATSIAKRLKTLAKVMNMEHEKDFADFLDIQPTTWNNYTTGRRPLTLAHALRCAERTGVTLDWLYLNDVSGLPARLVGLLSSAGKPNRNIKLLDVDLLKDVVAAVHHVTTKSGKSYPSAFYAEIVVNTYQLAFDGEATLESLTQDLPEKIEQAGIT